MQMTVFGSGSAGNCYLLHSPTEALIIEAGVRPESRMYACFGSDFSRLAGLLVSHRHADHAAYARQWSEGGVPVLATADVMERCAIHDPFSTSMPPLAPFCPPTTSTLQTVRTARFWMPPSSAHFCPTGQPKTLTSSSFIGPPRASSGLSLTSSSPTFDASASEMSAKRTYARWQVCLDFS